MAEQKRASDAAVEATASLVAAVEAGTEAECRASAAREAAIA